MQLKHFLTYCPYGLVFKTSLGDLVATGYGTNNINPSEYGVDFTYDDPKRQFKTLVHYEMPVTSKPYLRPLSQINEEINHNGETFIPIQRLFDSCTLCDGSEWYWINLRLANTEAIDSLPYWIVNKLAEWHFDFFGLTETGSALIKVQNTVLNTTT